MMKHQKLKHLMTLSEQFASASAESQAIISDTPLDDKYFDIISDKLIAVATSFNLVVRGFNHLKADSATDVLFVKICAECQKSFSAKSAHPDRDKYCSKTCYYRKNKRDLRAKQKQTAQNQ